MQYDENAEKYGYEGEMTPLKCDELKAYKGDVYIPVYGSIADAEVYLKSEADKVIAEKDKEITELKEQVHDYALGSYVMQARAEKEARHEKHKRCLAMAQEWRSYATFCGMQSSWHNNRGFGKTAEKWTWKECHAWRCSKRWLELAEKFKEAK